MNFIYTALIILMTVMPSNANSAKSPKYAKTECQFQEFKKPEGNPLILHTMLEVLHVRDIPDSGDSYGVDIK